MKAYQNNLTDFRNMLVHIAKEVNNKLKGTFIYTGMNLKERKMKVIECTCTFTDSDVRTLESERDQV